MAEETVLTEEEAIAAANEALASDNYEGVEDGETPFMKRFLALEHQSYIMYLQLNALTALLVNGSVVDKDKLVASMDEMNVEIQKITEEIEKEGQV